MVQPALRSIQMSGRPRPQGLLDRIEAELPRVPKPEPTVSSMAERFAPDALRASRPEPPRLLADDAALAGPPPRRPRFSGPARGVIFVLTAVALAPATILAGLLWFGAISKPEAVLNLTGPGTTPPAHEAAVAATPAFNPAPQPPEIALTAPEEIVAKAGDEVGFTIAIDTDEALPERSVIAIRDLPQGAAFSEGRPFGTGEWSLRPDEIAGLKLRLPNDQSGGSDMRVELVAADGALLAGTTTRLEVAPNPAAGLVVRSDEADRVEDLMAHGRKMVSVGYLAGARAYFQRAAEAGSGEAALAIGATYDPDVIAELGVQGIRPDPDAAKTWYDRASALGITDRDAKLTALKQEWAQPVAAQEETAAVPEEAAPTPVEQSKPARETSEPGPLGRLVAAASELTTKDQWVEVVSAVNVRSDASSDGTILKTVQKGTKLRVKGRDGNWIQITDPATKEEGYIYTRFLKESDAP
jgi:Bacterial SH3 domain